MLVNYSFKIPPTLSLSLPNHSSPALCSLSSRALLLCSSSMERPKCKLCSRTFANGRALGGHMKAHLATLPLPPKPQYSTSSASSDDKALIYGLRENPRRTLKFSDPEEDETEENEAESTRRQPKRARRTASEEEEEEEEDAAIAMCLVMLSRDKWTSSAAAALKSDVKRHRCEVCNKAFRSSQALGGHRVTHRKAMSVKEEAAAKYRRRFPYGDDEDEECEKIFECPYCFKVFGSGQALGGHKRSHLIGSANGSPPASSTKPRYQKQSSLLDLNLPAPTEEDDDRSVVSDGEIAEPPPPRG